MRLPSAGVSADVIIIIPGHKTRSVFDRYDITNEGDRRDAAQASAATEPGLFHVAVGAEPVRTGTARAEVVSIAPASKRS